MRNVHNLYLEAAATLGVARARAPRSPRSRSRSRRRRAARAARRSRRSRWRRSSPTSCTRSSTGTGRSRRDAARARLRGRPARGRAAPARRAAAAVGRSRACSPRSASAVSRVQTTLSRISDAASVSAADPARPTRAADVQPWSTEPWQRAGRGRRSPGTTRRRAHGAPRRRSRKDRATGRCGSTSPEPPTGGRATDALARASSAQPAQPRGGRLPRRRSSRSARWAGRRSEPDATRSPTPSELIRRLYAYVAYRIGDGPDAEDVTSEAFERALRYRAQLRPVEGHACHLADRDRPARASPTAPRSSQPLPDEHEETRSPDELEHERGRCRSPCGPRSPGSPERDRELVALRYGADLTARQIGEPSSACRRTRSRWRSTACTQSSGTTSPPTSAPPQPDGARKGLGEITGI